MPRSTSTLAAAFAISALTAVASGGAQGKPLSDADRAFITSDVQGARYELALAQQAQQASMRPDVKSYAASIASDHRDYNEQVEKLATSHDVAVPPGLTPDDKTRLDKMGDLSGAEYDHAFIAEAIRINAQDKKDSSAEAASTHEPAIKSFLGQFAAMDDKHEKDAEALRR